MQIHFHGGECCGVKHITGFYSQPNDTAYPKPETDKRNHDANGDNVRSDWDFCWEPLPNQTYRERLVAYINFLKRVRPSGAIELTLTGCQLNIYGWAPILAELGFKKVVEFWNSNSGDRVSIFYLVYGGKACAIEAYENYDGDDDDDDYYEGDE